MLVDMVPQFSLIVSNIYFYYNQDLKIIFKIINKCMKGVIIYHYHVMLNQ